MTRPAIALVTGFTKSRTLCERSLAPLRLLKARGILQRIIYVTWDTPGLDEFVAPVVDMPDVELVRVPQPQIDGTPYQKGVIYQIRNLKAALAQVAEDDALIFKLRPDFIIDEDFLSEKILSFDTLCAPSSLAQEMGITMPPSPFKAKIWVPWADSNQPFFFEDAAFLGLKQDVAKLASRKAEKYLDVLTDTDCGWFAHVVRFAVPFLPNFPIFERYMREFPYFPNDLEYRQRLLPAITPDPFFWHLIIANAWILATSFHVDCGYQGELSLYTNISNPDADWSRFESLYLNSPYDYINLWREGEAPGGVFPGAGRAYGRLLDDAWQIAVFKQPVLTDLTRDNLYGVLRNVAQYRQGAVSEVEDECYQRLARFYRDHWRKAVA